MQVQQEALTEEEVALLHQVQPVQICLQPQPDLVLCMHLHWSTSYNICLLPHATYAHLMASTTMFLILAVHMSAYLQR